MYVLVDGSSYLYRAYHAMPPLLSPQGQATGAVRGVLNMVQKLAADFAQAQLIIVFDAPGPTFRDELYAEYKAHRPAMPEDLRSQIAPLDALLQAEGYPLLRVSGVEADDVIATLARQAQRAGQPVLIATGDKDLAQLVGDGIELIDTMKGVRLDAAGVLDKFGVPPAAIVDYLSLVGDSADNIPGIPGIGPKTAAKLLQEFGSIEGILAHLEALPARHAENLRLQRERLPLLRQLIRVREDVPLDSELAALQRLPRDIARLRELYRELAFRGELAKLPEVPTDSPPHAAPGAIEPIAARIIPEQQPWMDFLPGVETEAVLTLSLLVDGEHPFVRLLGVGLASRAAAWYLPCEQDLYAPGWPEPALLDLLRELLCQPGRRLVGVQSKLLYQLLMQDAPVAALPVCVDLELMAYSLETRAASFEEQLEKHWQVQVPTLAALLGKGRARRSVQALTEAERATLTTQRAQWMQLLYPLLQQDLAASPQRQALYENIDAPLNRVLAAVERRGVLVDREELARQGAELRLRMQDVRAQAIAAAGVDFNLDSPKQLAEVLYERLQLQATTKTAGGQRSTAEEVLEGLSEQHALPRLVLEYRMLAKLCSTYIDKLPQLIQGRSGRVHTLYNAMGTSTGRLSSAEPNLQNIPIRRPEGRRIRDAFIAAPGHLLIAADYSQIELRLMAHLSADTSLLSAFAQHQDVHQMTAAEIFDCPLEQVSADQRRAAKAINFGLIYGMSAFGLARQLGLSRHDADAYVQRYFERYPGVREFMQKTRALAREQGYVETLWGRRIMTPEVRSSRPALRAAAERAAINAPLQGSAADIMRQAMLNVEARLQGVLSSGGVVMQVHDELIVECPAEALNEVREHLLAGMQSAAQLRVPLEVSCGQGRSWNQAQH